MRNTFLFSLAAVLSGVVGFSALGLSPHSAAACTAGMHTVYYEEDAGSEFGGTGGCCYLTMKDNFAFSGSPSDITVSTLHHSGTFYWYNVEHVADDSWVAYDICEQTSPECDEDASGLTGSYLIYGLSGVDNEIFSFGAWAQESGCF